MSTIATDSSLIKCPWCGTDAKSEDHDDNGWFIGCTNNSCDIKPSFWADDEKEAVQIWNSAKVS